MPITKLNLRHLRAFREVATTQSVSLAAKRVHLSQPAITQAISKLEMLLDAQLFSRQGSGMFLNEPGKLLLGRVERALRLLESGARLALRADRKNTTKGFRRFDQLVTSAQLRSLLAVAERGNFSLAARSIGISQPSLHRTARDLERLSGMALFKRVSQGIEMTAPAKLLAQHVRLAFVELQQGIEEILTWRGLDQGRIVVGTMPLVKTAILPQAINALLEAKPDVDISVIDGPYDDLLRGLRHGEMDLLIGALRHPLPIADVAQEVLFADPLAIVARHGHPLAAKKNLQLADLVDYPWALPREGTPTRDFFEGMFDDSRIEKPQHAIETSSMILIRGLLRGSNRLTILSAHQMSLEEQQGLLQRLDFDMGATSRDIGITLRKDWQPTPTQSLFLQLLRMAGSDVYQ